eukprot:6768307-Prymnesium_polylepis.1
MSVYCEGISGCLTHCELHTLARMGMQPEQLLYAAKVRQRVALRRCGRVRAWGARQLRALLSRCVATLCAVGANARGAGGGAGAVDDEVAALGLPLDAPGRDARPESRLRDVSRADAASLGTPHAHQIPGAPPTDATTAMCPCNPNIFGTLSLTRPQQPCPCP